MNARASVIGRLPAPPMTPDPAAAAGRAAGPAMDLPGRLAGSAGVRLRGPRPQPNHHRPGHHRIRHHNRPAAPPGHQPPRPARMAGHRGGGRRMRPVGSGGGAQQARPGGAAPWTPAKGVALGTLRWFRAGGGWRGGRGPGRVAGRQRALLRPLPASHPARPAPAAPPPTGTERPEGSKGDCPWRGSRGQRPLALLAARHRPARSA